MSISFETERVHEEFRKKKNQQKTTNTGEMGHEISEHQ